MSEYKVPQDVEAEDKIVGPFTLKQSIFIIIAGISGYLMFVLASVNLFLMIIPFPFFAVALVMGLYRRPDQPVEVYLQSLLRFHLKPRRRIWSQDGVMEFVKITAPPKVEHIFTDGRNRAQVENQLQNLANIMDTRGWASKNSSLQVPTQVVSSSDRLVSVRELPSLNQPTEIHAADDILDYGNNAVAQNMNQMSQNSYQQIHDYAAQPHAVDSAQMVPATFLPNANKSSVSRPEFKPYPVGVQQTIIRPLSDDVGDGLQTQKTNQDQTTSAMTQPASTDILSLAQDNNLSVSSIAKKVSPKEQDFDDEGEINLH